MTTANIYEIKTRFSHYLNLVQKGKTIVISKRNIPIAKISPIENIIPKRKIGQAKGEFEIPDSFYDPLPNDLLEAFNNPK